jgi:hypothetical protein
MQLDLTIDQINIILQSLGNAPYIQVAPVIAEIQKQAAPQVQATAVPEG